MNKNKILSESIVIFDRHLQVNLKEAMGLALKKLFHQAENATSNQEEQELFNQYRQLKSGAKDLSNTIRTKIKSMPEFISAEVNKSDKKMSLSLVEDEELSITLSLTQLDSTLEVVSHAELYTLEKRMNVIFGNEKIDKTNMPFSPASIVWLLSHAFQNIDFAVQVKTLIIDFLTKEFSRKINDAYHEINEVFIKAGILPNIQPEMTKPQRQAPHKGGGNVEDQMEQQSVEDGQLGGQGGPQSPGAGYAAGSHPGNAYAGGGQPAGGQSANMPPGQSGSGMSAGQQPNAPGMPGQAQSGIEAGEYQPQVRQYDPQTKQLVESIFDLLSPAQGSAVTPTQSTPVSSHGQKIADHDFDLALSQIAQESGVVATSKNIHNLKEMLADQVKNNTGNYYPELSPKQNKTLDLMGMVYDEIENDQSIDTHIRSSFNAINVPLLRMAVNDDNFFTDAAHPARKFMELLVESSQKWHGTNVIKKIHQYSDSAAKAFDGSTSSFVNALEELTEYLDVTQNRAEKAEQKWISAAQGKEKMELTKTQVEAHLDEILKGCDVKFIRDIIHHVWKDSLTLTLLREGKDSEQWDKKTRSAKIISQIGNKKEFMNLSGPEKLAAMHHLDETMDELGFSKRDRISTKDNIHTCLGWQESDEADKEETKPKLKKVLSIDEAVKSQEIETANKKIEEIRELSDQEKLIMEKVINMPYGSLFDFVINQQKDKLRRKLSWVSTMSETVLFVDLVGRHPHKMKLPRLAIDINRNNIIRVELPEGGYFRNALNKIMDRLKKMAA